MYCMSSKPKGEQSPFKVLDAKHLKIDIDMISFSCYNKSSNKGDDYHEEPSPLLFPAQATRLYR